MPEAREDAVVAKVAVEVVDAVVDRSGGARNHNAEAANSLRPIKTGPHGEEIKTPKTIAHEPHLLEKKRTNLPKAIHDHSLHSL